MKFKMPETLDGLDADALNTLLQEAVTAYGDLAVIDDVELTDAQLEDLEVLAVAVETVQAEVSTRETALAARTEKIAAAKAKIESATAEETTEEVVVDETTETPAGEAVDEVVVPDDASEITEEQSVVASAGKKRVVQRLASKVPEVEQVAPKELPVASLVAAADVRGFTSGQKLEDTLDAAKAFLARLSGFPAGYQKGLSLKAGAFSIHKVTDERFALNGRSIEEDYDKVMAAAKDQREGGSLVAGGGWCAPSETMYNIPSLETISGILTMPEVTFNRGGINFTKGINFEDIYAATGFKQTEAQAIAEVPKTFLSVTCPAFEEVRMDAIGWGLKAPILTSKTYPELIKRFLDGALVAHAHKMNVEKISRIVAFLGVAINATEYGSAVGDSLTALEQQAIRLRYKYRMAESTKMTGFAPVWFKAVLRADLAFRGGLDSLAVSDAQITAWLSARNISLQFVYDWQDLAAVGTAYPATVQVALYPAGTFVAGTSDVISIDAIYDSVELAKNMYTAAFFEEGLAVFNPVGNGVLVEIALDYHGRMGAHNITSVVV